MTWEATISQQLARFVAGLSHDAIPEAVIDDATWRLGDFVGVSLVGSRQADADALAGVVEEAGGAGSGTVIGLNIRAPFPLAAFANGVLAHLTDYDDTHGRSLVHITSVVGPVALAVGEKTRASGADVILAMVAGAEVALRIGGPVGHRLLVRGLHVTATIGPFAAAATASLLLKLDAGQTANALGIAGSRAVGLRQGSHDGSSVKQLYSGGAAQWGIMAALLARRGLTGPSEVVEGRYGLYKALLSGETVATEEVLDDLGKRWWYPETTFKLYPNGSWNHASMSAVSDIVRQEGLRHQDIARIDCTLPPVGVAAVAEPRDVRLHPKTPYHMKFSLPYGIAMLVVLGHVTAEDFTTENLANQALADFAARVFCRGDDRLSAKDFPAVVRVTTRDGRSWELSVPAQKGSAANPLTREDHLNKLRSSALPSLGSPRTQALVQAIESIMQARDVENLMVLLREGGPAGEQVGGPTTALVGEPE